MNDNNDVTERIESLAQLAARQNIVTKPLADAIAEHGETRMVTSFTRQTGFGNFLLGWTLRESLVLCADNDHGTRPHGERSRRCRPSRHWTPARRSHERRAPGQHDRRQSNPELEVSGVVDLVTRAEAKARS